MSDYLNNTAHVLCTGVTGAGDGFGGKTVLCNYLLERAIESGEIDCGIFFNVKGHGFVRGVKCHNIKQVATLWNEGERLFNYVPTSDNPQAEHSKLLDTFRRVSGKKWFVHDECHLLNGSSELDWCFRMGGNVGNGRYRTGNIRSIAITQHPWDLDQSVLNNCPLTFWVGPKTPESKRYFQTMQLASVYENMPDMKPYHWAVIDGGRLVEINSPVPEEYAK